MFVNSCFQTAWRLRRELTTRVPAGIIQSLKMHVIYTLNGQPALIKGAFAFISVRASQHRAGYRGKTSARRPACADAWLGFTHTVKV